MAKPNTNLSLARYGLKDSLSVLQINTLLRDRDLDAATLAAAIGQTENSVVNWLTGKTAPSVLVIESALRFLEVVPVFVSINDDLSNAGLRDYLTPEERALYDGFSDDPREILLNQLRDLQLQRIRVEKDYSTSLIEDEDYRETVLDIIECIRRIGESFSRLTIATGWTGAPSSIEWVHGSEIGPGYDKKGVTRVKAQRKKKLAEKAAATLEVAATKVEE